MNNVRQTLEQGTMEPHKTFSTVWAAEFHEWDGRTAEKAMKWPDCQPSNEDEMKLLKNELEGNMSSTWNEANGGSRTRGKNIGRNSHSCQLSGHSDGHLHQRGPKNKS
jgi:hypothetical protein